MLITQISKEFKYPKNNVASREIRFILLIFFVMELFIEKNLSINIQRTKRS